MIPKPVKAKNIAVDLKALAEQALPTLVVPASLRNTLIPVRNWVSKGAIKYGVMVYHRATRMYYLTNVINPREYASQLNREHNKHSNLAVCLQTLAARHPVFDVFCFNKIDLHKVDWDMHGAGYARANTKKGQGMKAGSHLWRLETAGGRFHRYVCAPADVDKRKIVESANASVLKFINPSQVRDFTLAKRIRSLLGVNTNTLVQWYSRKSTDRQDIEEAFRFFKHDCLIEDLGPMPCEPKYYGAYTRDKNREAIHLALNLTRSL